MIRQWMAQSLALTATAFRRFPASMAFACMLTALLVWGVDQGRTLEDENLIFRLAIPLSVAIPASIALHMRLELGAPSTGQRILMFAGLVAVTAGYAWWLPSEGVRTLNLIVQWLLLFLAAHVCISLAQYTPQTDGRRFWAVNIRILFRAVTGALFTGALTVGFLLAVAGTDFLFDLNIRVERYIQIALISHGILMTAFILADMPKPGENLELEVSMPPALKLFNLYVLVPLAFVYLAILTAYSIQIAAKMSMPKGIVASMILYYCIVGLGAILLVFPLIGKAEYRFPNVFFRFFRVTLPLVMILFWIALGVRIGDYGFTVERTLVAWLGLWLTGVSIWLLSGRRHRLHEIPTTLGLTFLLAALGPLSVSKLSKDSQIRQVGHLVEALPGDALPEKIRHTAELDSAQASRVGDILGYLATNHGLAALQAFSDEPMDALIARLQEQDTTGHALGHWELQARIFKEWQIPDRYGLARQVQYWHLQTPSGASIPISGFDVYAPVQLPVAATDSSVAEIYRGPSMSVVFDPGPGDLVIHDGDRSHRFALEDTLASLAVRSSTEPNRAWAELDTKAASIPLLEVSGQVQALLFIENAALWRENDVIRLQQLQGRLFLRLSGER